MSCAVLHDFKGNQAETKDEAWKRQVSLVVKHWSFSHSLETIDNALGILVFTVVPLLINRKVWEITAGKIINPFYEFAFKYCLFHSIFITYFWNHSPSPNSNTCVHFLSTQQVPLIIPPNGFQKSDIWICIELHWRKSVLGGLQTLCSL